MSDHAFNSQTVAKLAELARIELTKTEIENFGSHIQKVLSYIDKLSDLKTDQIEPMVNPFEGSLETYAENPFREDQMVESPGSEKMLKSAPESLYENYKVPQVLGGES